MSKEIIAARIQVQSLLYNFGISDDCCELVGNALEIGFSKMNKQLLIKLHDEIEELTTNPNACPYCGSGHGLLCECDGRGELT